MTCCYTYIVGKDPDSMVEAMNKVLEKLSSWLTWNNLIVNVKKTKAMFISKKGCGGK